MTYCQECGSEVAEQDLFCPYCGISMRPVGTADKSADPFESTVVMSASSIPVSPDILAPIEEPLAEAEISSSEEPAVEVAAEPEQPAPAEELAPVDLFDQIASSPSVAVPEMPMILAEESAETEAESESVEVQPEPEALAEETPAAEEELDVVPEPESEPEVFDETPFEPEAVEAEPAVSDEPAEEPAVEPETIVTEAPSEPEAVEQVEAELAEPEVQQEMFADAPEIEAAEEPAAEEPEEPETLVIEEISTETPPTETAETPAEPAVDEIDEPSAERLSFDLAPANEEPAQPEKKVGDTSSGEIANGGRSFTVSNLDGESTDGRRSGLKPLSEGTLLNNRYQIVKKIGGGGMGAVYLAVDQNLGGTHRAVKEMVQSHIEEEAQAKAIEDFKRESMILSTLDHPSIPTIYDYFYDAAESRFYLVMKYISGGDLAARLRSAPEGRIDERTVTEWAVQIIDVLHYLHSLPTTIVYRDLKPSNVMIDGNTGRIMLIDFGIARSINQRQEKGVTAVGTMGYAPPELFSGQVEPRSDIYSLGSTMFHLLTGADPQNNPLLIFDFQKNPRPRQINPRLSDQMERILMRSVEYNAESRFSSALEMKVALQQHLDDLNTGRVTHGITEVPAAVSLANQNVFCGFCGQRIVATDLFCAFCGSKQPIAQQGVHSEIYGARSAATARLIIDGTSELESPAYSLEKNENLVGRRDPMSNIFPEVDLSKWDPQTKISRRHARIWRDGSSFLVEDLGSSNGTMLLTSLSGTLRLSPHKPHPLQNGDRIRVGDTTLHFIVG